jgi:hypothetical protein
MALLLVPNPVAGMWGHKVLYPIQGGPHGALNPLFGTKTPLDEVLAEHEYINSGLPSPDDLSTLPSGLTFYRPDKPKSPALTPDEVKAILFPFINGTTVANSTNSTGAATEKVQGTASLDTSNTTSNAANPAATAVLTQSRIQHHKRSETAASPDDGTPLIPRKRPTNAPQNPPASIAPKRPTAKPGASSPAPRTAPARLPGASPSCSCPPAPAPVSPRARALGRRGRRARPASRLPRRRQRRRRRASGSFRPRRRG